MADWGGLGLSRDVACPLTNAGKVLAMHKLETPVNGLEHDWAAIWQTPAWGAAAVLVILLIFFKDPGKVKAGTSAI
jgi:hypothetical protein